MRPDADQVVCLATRANFSAIGQFYRDFRQVSDEQVANLLDRAAGRAIPAAARVVDAQAGADAGAPDPVVTVQAGGVRVAGNLSLPENARGIVLFAHGSGSSRHSPRNRYVAGVLNHAGLGTLLFDLLTVEEEVDRANVFAIDLLARRLFDATTWLSSQPETKGLRIGYFGASTGAAAALVAAAQADAQVAAVVSRGGRPDLAGAALAKVRAPTLLIVGGRDGTVLDLNRAAQARLRCENRVDIVPGATHLFEEPGALERVAELAADWFITRLTAP
jgi:putative phosphoribosyl transferase